MREWGSDHLWAPGYYHGSVGNDWEVVEKYISAHNSLSITGDNPGKRYIQALDICPGYTGDCENGSFMLE